MIKHECDKMKKALIEGTYSSAYSMVSILCFNGKYDNYNGEGYCMHVGIESPDIIPIDFCPFCGEELKK